MKRLAFLIALFSLSTGVLLGQTNQVGILDEPSPVTTEKIEREIRSESETFSRALEVKVRYRGVAPAAFKADNPLQLINPLAPAKYGNGFDNLSIDPVTGRAQGITLFAIRF